VLLGCRRATVVVLVFEWKGNGDWGSYCTMSSGSSGLRVMVPEPSRSIFCLIIFILSMLDVTGVLLIADVLLDGDLLW